MNLNLLDAAVAIVISLLVIVFIIAFILFIFKVQHNRRVKPKPKKREALERPIIPPTIIHTKDGDIVPLYYPKTILVPRAGSKVRTDVGKFMKKHGKQSSSYRASVKRKRQPKDDEF